MSRSHIKTKAIQLHQQGQLDSAKSCYQAYLDEYPDDADACHAYGVLLAQLREYHAALEMIQRALSFKTNHASFYNSLGNVYTHLDDYDAAISAYQAAVKKQPGYASAYNNLGRLLVRLEKKSAAKKAYEKAITIQPDFADAHANLGILFVAQENDTQAIEHLTKAATLKPHFLTPKRQLADIYLRQSNFEKAIELLLACVTQQPGRVDDYHQLGIAYYHANKLLESEAAFEQVLLLDPKHPQANHHLGNALLASCEYEKALTYYLRQLATEPMFESYYNAGCLLMAKDRLNEAIQYFKAVESDDPQHLATQLNLGSIYLKQQNMTQAILHYQKAADIDPADSEITHILAALKQNQLPKKAPDRYLQHLFDQYAAYYDKHLTDCLQYHMPELLHQTLDTEIDLSLVSTWRILDLGCGTGLSGAYFKPHAIELIGIDLSEKMLSVAKAKNIYDRLIQADITQAVSQYHDIDCVIAADVFTYIGDLDQLFADIADALNPGGYFLFTVEKTQGADFCLQPSIRYAHSKNYLNRLISDYSFSVLRFDNVVLRKQHNLDVEGYLVVLSSLR